MIYFCTMSQIYIYSGPIHSGKTTRLKNWAGKTASVDGVLAPVIEGQRYLKFISDETLQLLETDSTDAGIVQQIGKYKFLNSVFQKAQMYLLSLINLTPEWIVVDEIGYLEMAGKGLEPAVSQIINKLEIVKNVKIVLVIRDTLVEPALKYYKLDAHSTEVFNPDNKLN